METLETLDDGAPPPIPKPPEPETLDPSPVQRRRRVEPRAPRTGVRGRGSARVSSGAVESPSVETLVSSDSSSRENPLFPVGDLVWGKIKGHQWWPGKVVDPSEQHGSTDRGEEDPNVLVAFFGGGGDFAWCEHTQLKPFKEGFNQVVKQGNSASFVGAVKDALNEVRKCLDSEFACYCVVEEDPTKILMEKRHFDEKYGVCGRVGALPITNYSPGQFLEHLRETARDVLAANMLEVTMLLSWAAATQHANCCSVLFGEVYADQVEECEVNGPGDADKNKAEEDCQVPKQRSVKGPDISKESNRKKERSIAELIGVTESVKAEIHDDKGEKENIGLNKMGTPSSSSSRKRKKRAETDKSFDAENGGLLAFEEMSSDRRERKKSKYLLPPFTHIGGYSKRPLSTSTAEDGMPEKVIEASQAVPAASPSSSLKLGNKTALLLIDDDASVEKILYEFLAAASDHLHLKRNHSVRPVKYFFDKFRSCAYIEGSESESYKHFLGGANNVDTKSVNKDVGDVSRKRKFSGKRIKRKVEANRNTSEQGDDMNTTGKDKAAIVETHLALDLNYVNGPEEVKPARKKRTKKGDAGGQSLAGPTHEPINYLKEATPQNRTARSRIVDNDSSPVLKGHKLIYQSETSNSDKKKSRKAANGGSVANSDQKHANGRDKSKPRQKRENIEGTKYRNSSPVLKSPAAKTPLPYIKRSLEKMISKLSGSTTHEKETGSSMRLRLEVEVNLLGEMECMLEKVNKLLTEPSAGTLV